MSPATDPVCGMQVDPGDATPRHDEGGVTWYFCCDGCRARFAAGPARYASAHRKQSAPRAIPGTTYTCPMHPEVSREGPGDCPICGMALEPRVTLAATPGGDASRGELRDMTRRLLAGTALTVPLVVLAMGAMLPGR